MLCTCMIVPYWGSGNETRHNYICTKPYPFIVERVGWGLGTRLRSGAFIHFILLPVQLCDRRFGDRVISLVPRPVRWVNDVVVWFLY